MEGHWRGAVCPRFLSGLMVCIEEWVSPSAGSVPVECEGCLASGGRVQAFGYLCMSVLGLCASCFTYLLSLLNEIAK